MKKIFALRIWLMVIFLITLLVFGCAKKTIVGEEKTTEVQSLKELPDTEKTSEAMKDVNEIEQDVEDRDVDNLDEELEQLDW